MFFITISSPAFSLTHCALDTLPFSLLCSGSTTMSFSPPQSFTRHFLPPEHHSSPIPHLAGSLPSRKSSLNVTSSQRPSDAICICQDPGGKQWHAHKRIIQGGLIKGLFIKAPSKTKGDRREGEKPPRQGGMEEQNAGCSQPRVILQRRQEKRHHNRSLLSDLLPEISLRSNRLEARGREIPLRPALGATLPEHRLQ